MKQTAIEFLQEALSIHLTFDQQMRFEGLFQQAKEMEKKQRLEKYSERFNNDESAIGNQNTWGKRIIEEPKQEKLDCPFDFTSRCTMGRCDCKPKQKNT